MHLHPHSKVSRYAGARMSKSKFTFLAALIASTHLSLPVPASASDEFRFRYSMFGQAGPAEEFPDIIIPEDGSCPTPWGDYVSPGGSVTAYLAGVVPEGSECLEEVRNCASETLSGSYGFAMCVVDEPGNSPDPFEFLAIHDRGRSLWTMSEAIAITGMDRDLPIAISGKNALYRICQSLNCTSAPWLTQPSVIAPGQFVQIRMRSPADFSDIAVAGLQIGATTGSWAIHSRIGQTCTTPWGAVLAHREAATAYETTSVLAGEECKSEQRTCSNGSLSGSHTAEACVIEAQVVDLDPVSIAPTQEGTPNSVLIKSTNPVTGFTGRLMVDITWSDGLRYPFRFCDASGCGPLNSNPKELAPGQSIEVRGRTGDYGTTNTATIDIGGHMAVVWEYSPAPPQNCTAPWGAVVLHGAAITAWEAGEATTGNCQSAQRSCNNGNLTGNYQFESCTETLADDAPNPFEFPDFLGLQAGVWSNPSPLLKIEGFDGPLNWVTNMPAGMQVQFKRCTHPTTCPTSGWGTFTNFNAQPVQDGTWLELRARATDPGADLTATFTLGSTTVSTRVTTLP